MAKFTAAPAGMKNHHAYKGGLLEHVVSLMELVLVVAPRYPQLDQDKLLVGAFLHDAAKVDELSYDRDIAYTDEGQLLGHMVMAMTMIDDKVREAERLAGEPFPKQLVTEIKHMVVSHHGEYEYGSPKLPMTLEAVALHHLDNLDAKMASFTQLMNDCPNVESNWTQYHTQPGPEAVQGLASLASRLSRWCRATASSVIGSFGLPYSYSPWWLTTMCLISVTSCFGNGSPESRSASRTLSSIIVMARTMWPRSWPSSV